MLAMQEKVCPVEGSEKKSLINPRYTDNLCNIDFGDVDKELDLSVSISL